MATKTAEIHLPYFKQGSDLNGCLNEFPDSMTTALEAHAQNLDEASRILREVKKAITDVPDVSFDANNHMILIYGPEELIDSLVKDNLASIPDWMDEDEDEFLDYDDEDEEDFDDDEDD